MKNLRGKTSYKICIFVACIISGAILASGLFATALCYSVGYYQGKDSSEIQKKFYGKAYRIDAIKALSAGEKDQYNKDNFTNYEFAILEGEDLSKAELKDSNNYLECTFSNGFPKNYTLNTFQVGKKTEFHNCDSYFASSWIEHGYDKEEIAVDHLIVVDDGEFEGEEGQPVDAYALANGNYYWLDDCYYSENGGYYISDVQFSPEEVEVRGFSDFEIDSDYEVEKISVSKDKSDITISVYGPEKEVKNYTVISSSKDTVKKGTDFIYEANYYYGYSKSIAKAAPIAIAVGGVLAIVCFILLMYLAGYHETASVAKKDIYEAVQLEDHLYLQRRGLDKIPMDLNLVIMISFVGMLFALLQGIFYGTYADVFSLTMLACGSVSVACVVGGGAVLYCMTLAANFKCPAWWKNTICYGILRFLHRKWRAIRRNINNSFRLIKLHVRIWIIFGIITFCELFGLTFVLDSFHFTILFAVWVAEKLVFAIILNKLLGQFALIKETTEKMANGDLSCRVDTDKMFMDFQEEGNYMNSIRDGLDLAIAQRMKSERFQTELITNVSHDIKTPLTSIINYVDLLGKEDLKNEKAKEYLEVLQRQSQRLKKLLQDLLDASKASTGSVELHMEKMNVSVLLNQIMGEFEEKLKASGMELKAKVPNNIPPINADSQYLWRVLDNLMTNICKYGQPATRAYLNLEVKDKNVEISFLNTSKEELNISAEELMQRFVRGDSSRNTEGSGLGLSIAKSLTQLMGGKLNLSIDGDLFKVVVTFPIC